MQTVQWKKLRLLHLQMKFLLTDDIISRPLPRQSTDCPQLAPTSHGSSASSPTPLPAHQRPDSDDEDEANVQETVPEVPSILPSTGDVSKRKREQE